MRTAIAIIDGTGEWDDANYGKKMAGSFCSQLRDIFPDSHYERGPSDEGLPDTRAGAARS